MSSPVCRQNSYPAERLPGDSQFSFAAEQAADASSSDSAKPRPLERRLLRRLLEELGRPDFSVVLWDGEEIAAEQSKPAARLVIKNRPAFWRVVLDPEMQFGEMFSAAQIEIEGDLIRFLEAFHRARLSSPRSKSAARRLAEAALSVLRNLVSSNSIAASRSNIHRHYDLGNDFYRLWLDRQMVYSCGYFADPDMPLEDAQTAKMDLICRKLELHRDERVFEVGSGWGAMAIHMAKRYGARVSAFNISEEQLDYSRARLQQEGLGGRVEFIRDDYRNISGRFDAFVSIGMLEHVGAKFYREFGRVIDRCLKNDGRGLMHSIGQDRPSHANPWIKRRIFPGGYIPSLRQMLEIWEPLGMSIVDVENLRLHYAKTLRHWLRRFNAVEDRVLRQFDENFLRAWRLYLSSSAAAFESGALQLFQVLFSRPGVNNRRWTREQMYLESK